jgi:secretion/DNA translocation related TadE-like protein
VDVIRGERGAATVWALALVNIVLLVGLCSATVGAFAVTRQRVATVADVAALVGAQAISDPCVSAGASAAANGMAMVGGVVDGADVIVQVSAAAPPVARRLLALLGHSAPDVTASARAGLP